MKCVICGIEFEPSKDTKQFANVFCDDCAETRDEVTNGKEDK